MGAKSKKDFAGRKNNSPHGGVRRTRGGRWRGKGRQAPRVRREYESTKHYLERFAPCVNAGCGGLNTLTRNRRTFVWSSFVWVAQNVCYGFRQDFARILPRLCPSLAMEFVDGKASESPAGGTKSILGGSKIELRSPRRLPRAAQEPPRQQISSFSVHFLKNSRNF